MMRAAILAACALMLLPTTARAHRLDEYLQASRVAIDRDRIDVEVDLTPGISVSPQVIESIDTDVDGRISDHEADTYARVVLAALTLDVDGHEVALELIARQFPSPEAMSQGTGTIRLTAAARPDPIGRGTHHVRFRNGHRPDMGVYLANALVPRNPAITIGRQQRDALQHELRIEFQVAPAWLWTLSWSGAAVLAMAGLLVVRARRQPPERAALSRTTP